LVEDVTINLNILEPSIMKKFLLDLQLQRHAWFKLQSQFSNYYLVMFLL